jgi:hypothetical protein
MPKYPGLTSFRDELILAASNASLPKDRRLLSMTLLDEIDSSTTVGFVGATEPTDGFVDALPIDVQREMWLLITLRARWESDRPKSVQEPVKSLSAGHSIPDSILSIPKTTESNDFEFEGL